MGIKYNKSKEISIRKYFSSHEINDAEDLIRKAEWLAEQRGTDEAEVIKFALEDYLDSAIKKYIESKRIMEESKK